MRVVSIERYGGPDVLHLAQVPKPVPGRTEILVRVRAAGVNPADLKQRVGDGPLSLPLILGYDVAGVVESTGQGVTLFSPGDEVYGLPHFPHQAGAYAEYVTGPSHHFAPKPSVLSFDEASTMPIAGLTAWQVLVEAAKVRPGQRVLVHGGAGAVGMLAVQIAKAHGAHVIATAKGDDLDFVSRLGADEVIDYTTVAFEDRVAEIDVVVDVVGGEISRRSLGVLCTGGLLVSVPDPVSDEISRLADTYGVRVTDFQVEPDHAGMLALSDLIERGLLRTRVGAVVPLEEVRDAHRLAESGQVPGKVVLSTYE